MRYVGALILAILFTATLACGQSQSNTEIPKVVLSGLDAYKAGGPDEAIKAWLKGSPIEGSKDAMAQANGLRQIQDYYGTYRNWELIDTIKISPSTRDIYMVLDYDKGPLFARFVVYRTADQSWILTSFNFNTHAELVLPAGKY